MIISEGTTVFDQDTNEYEVHDYIGSGSFGQVYRIERKDNSQTFALKTLHTPFTDPTTLRAFINEGNLATSVSHENVIKYFFFHDGTMHSDLPPYIIMEYAPEGTLEGLLDEQRGLNEFFSNDDLRRFFSQLINGMEAINSVLVHRDIKPDNILISADSLKITDFGLSKVVEEATRTSTFKGFGCIPYLAPEGWKSEKNTIQMDIYSMGFVFYEIATLKHPLEVSSNDIEEWRRAHLFQNPKPVYEINPEVSPVLSQMILKMIEKDTRDRLSNWQIVRELLQRETADSKPTNSIVETALRRRLEQDSETTKKRLAEEARQREIQEFKDIVWFQFERDIVSHIQKFREEFNNQYEGSKVTFTRDRTSKRCTLTLPSSKRIAIEIQPIIKEDFYRTVDVEDYGRRVQYTELQMPKLDDKNIMAWGLIKGEDGRGFNLILIEREEELYGDWRILRNTNNPFGKRKRIEPFPFGFNEIEREIQCIRALHVYDTEVKPLDINSLLEFFLEYI